MPNIQAMVAAARETKGMEMLDGLLLAAKIRDSGDLCSRWFCWQVAP